MIHRHLSYTAISTALTDVTLTGLRNEPGHGLSDHLSASCKLEAVMDQGQVAGGSQHEDDEGDQVQAGQGLGQAFAVSGEAAEVTDLADQSTFTLILK